MITINIVSSVYIINSSRLASFVLSCPEYYEVLLDRINRVQDRYYRDTMMCIAEKAHQINLFDRVSSYLDRYIGLAREFLSKYSDTVMIDNVDHVYIESEYHGIVDIPKLRVTMIGRNMARIYIEVDRAGISISLSRTGIGARIISLIKIYNTISIENTRNVASAILLPAMLMSYVYGLYSGVAEAENSCLHIP